MSDSDRSEASLRARARMLIPDTIVGTDLITVEVSGQSEDVILTPDYAEYLREKLTFILPLPREVENLRNKLAQWDQVDYGLAVGDVITAARQVVEAYS